MSQYTVVRKLGEGAYGKALLVTKRGGTKKLVVKEVNVLKVRSASSGLCPPSLSAQCVMLSSI